jgi:hypothetical protein
MKKFVVLCLMVVSSLGFSFNYADYANAKVMGMGGAYTALANDEMALFYNPAGLAFIDSGAIGHVNFEFNYFGDEGMTEIDDILSDFEDESTGAINWVSPNLATLLSGKAGLFNTSVGASYYKQNFAVGGHTSVFGTMRFDDNGQRIVPHINQMGSLGLSEKLADNIAVGITFKAIQKGESFAASYTWQELVSEDAKSNVADSSQLIVGRGLGANVGVMAKSGGFSFGLSIQDAWLSELKWEDKDGNEVIIGRGRSDALKKPIIRLGIGYAGDHMLIGADLAKPDDADNQTIHLGVQRTLLAIPFLSFLGDITLRGGYLSGKQQGYDVSSTSVGAIFRFLIFKMNINNIVVVNDGRENKGFNLSLQMEF